MNTLANSLQNSDSKFKNDPNKIIRACAEAALELKYKREQMRLLEQENNILREQNKELNEKADLAIKLVDNKDLTIKEAKDALSIVNDLIASYEKSIASYKTQLDAKNSEIKQLKKSRFKRMFGGLVVGVVVGITGGLLLTK